MHCGCAEIVSSSDCANDPQEILHDEQEMIGIARARLEVEMLVEALGLIILGMDE